MFVEPEDRARVPAMRTFWAKLNRGEFEAANTATRQGGREVWILATYNPILDETGKPFKVVKFATDITAQKTEGGRQWRPDRRDPEVAGRDRIRDGRHDPTGERRIS